jgi:ribose transport system ATP-binding protein
MVSNEITEIIGLCDRIIVVRQGQTVFETAGSAATEEILMEYALKDTPPAKGKKKGAGTSS